MVSSRFPRPCIRLWTDLSSSCKREGKKKERGGERKRFQFNPCQSICLLRIESFVIDELLRVMYTTCNEFGYLKEKRKRKKRKKKRGEERKRKRETTVQPTVLKNFHRLPGFLPFFLFFFFLFVWKSSIGRKTFWKYEGADGIVFNEVWPELHLPLSRHLGPAAVTLPRAQFKKLAGTHPSFLQIRSSSIYLRFYLPRALNPPTHLSSFSFVPPSIFSIDPPSTRCVVVHI